MGDRGGAGGCAGWTRRNGGWHRQQQCTITATIEIRGGLVAEVMGPADGVHSIDGGGRSSWIAKTWPAIVAVADEGRRRPTPATTDGSWIARLTSAPDTTSGEAFPRVVTAAYAVVPALLTGGGGPRGTAWPVLGGADAVRYGRREVFGPVGVATPRGHG